MKYKHFYINSHVFIHQYVDGLLAGRLYLNTYSITTVISGKYVLSLEQNVMLCFVSDQLCKLIIIFGF